MQRISGQRWVLTAVVVLAAALHAYENLPKAGAPATWGWFLWGMLPYAVFSLGVRLWAHWLPAIGAASAALVLDSWAHYSVFIAPGGSTAALALLFVPLWNTLLVGPAAGLLVWILARHDRRHGNSL